MRISRNNHISYDKKFYLSTAALKYALLFFLSGMFLNVFFINDDLYDATRISKILFVLKYLLVLILIAIPILFKHIKSPIDPITLLILAFSLWIMIVGKPGGIWYDEKFYYLFGGIVFFFISKEFIRFTNEGHYSFNPLLIPVFFITITGGVEAVLGQLQIMGGYKIYHNIFRITGTFFNPAPYAGFLLACFPYALYLAICKGLGKWTSWVGVFCSMAMFAILPATQSRAAWLGIVVAGGLWLFYFYDFKLSIKKIIFKNSKVAIILSVLILFGMAASGYLLYHYKKDSADGRLLIWKISGELIKEAPLTGHGFNTYQAKYAPALANYFDTGKGSDQEELLAGNVKWAFNEPLQWAVELGLPGAVVFILLVGCAFCVGLEENLKKQEKLLVYTARTSLAGIMVFGLFSYPFYSGPITVLFFFSLAVISVYAKGLLSGQIAAVIKGATIGCILVFWLYVLLQVPGLKKAYWLWNEAEIFYSVRQYERANESYDEALPILNRNGLFMQQYGKSLYMAGEYLLAVDILKKGGKFYKDDFWYIILGDAYRELHQFELAEKYYLLASRMVPHKLYPKYLLANLYSDFGSNDLAQKMARDILTSEVKIMSAAVKDIRKEMKAILEQSVL